jgi:hypothetical protein
MIYFNPKRFFFEDIKMYNAFIRIRREHLKKLGVRNYLELDFYEVRLVCINNDLVFGL